MTEVTHLPGENLSHFNFLDKKKMPGQKCQVSVIEDQCYYWYRQTGNLI